MQPLAAMVADGRIEPGALVRVFWDDEDDCLELECLPGHPSPDIVEGPAPAWVPRMRPIPKNALRSRGVRSGEGPMRPAA